LRISVQQAEKLNGEQIRTFLAAREEVEFEAGGTEIYGWNSGLLQANSYHRQGRQQRGLQHRYIEKLTGLSRAQVTRLIGSYLKSREVKTARYQRHRFTSRYTRADVELLAEVDEAHDTLSGPAYFRASTA
jgi:hypothetical protein